MFWMPRAPLTNVMKGWLRRRSETTTGVNWKYHLMIQSDGRLTDMWKVYKSFSGVGSRWLFLRNVLLLHFVETIYGTAWNLIEQNFVNSLAIIQISIVLARVFS